MSARDVFINCPFSEDYQDKFRTIVFTVIRCGFAPRCARENDDAGEVRIEKICRIIRECAYGIHDISKTELDSASGLPRFNMPFELGLFLGMKILGPPRQRGKKTLILDVSVHRYQTFLSDIAGQDVHSHGGQVNTLIREIASWLRDETPGAQVPGGKIIAQEYAGFRDDVPAVCATKRLAPEEMTFKDLTAMAAQWIAAEIRAGRA
jgi:hypothetical protein